MATLNKKNTYNEVTHEGAPAARINYEQQLRRSVMSCMLWESTFYEDGITVAERIMGLVSKVKPEICANIAIEAREQMKLRHVPLLITRTMAQLDTHKHLVANVLERIIQRPDELTEFMAIYWKDKRQPISAQSKLGLARAFQKFNEYQLAKYNRDSAIKLRDILFMVHAKPKDKAQEDLWKRLIDNKLALPDTWEVQLSAGKNKKETWERLLKENKLGGLALLRNLRNMQEVNVDMSLIRESISNMKTDRILPFRFLAAANYAPKLETELEQAMMSCLANQDKLLGKTVLLIDVSGSMGATISAKSDLTRLDAACGLAMLLREIGQEVVVYTFSNHLKLIPARHGFALKDAIKTSQDHSGTYLGRSLEQLQTNENYDRLIVLTDEQTADRVPKPTNKAYMINIATNKNGVGYGDWIHIDGWSESVIDYIKTFETLKEE